METERLVTSPRVNEDYRERMKAMVPELRLNKYSDVVGFLLNIYDLLFEGKKFKTVDERITFVKNLLEDKDGLAKENVELRLKLEKLQRVIEE